MTRIKKLLPPLLAVLVVTAMTAAAELSGEREILFPEIAAIAAGALVSPRLKWRTNGLRLWAFITGGAVLGLLAVYLPLTLWAKMSLAFAAASLMLELSGTGFAPMISSVVLPVMLGTESAVYPISAAVLTGAVVLLRAALERFGLAEKTDFTPLPPPDRKRLAGLLLRWLSGSLVIAAAVLSGYRLAAAPPLLVAFTEFARPGSPAVKKPAAVTAFIPLCALAGAALRGAALCTGVYQFLAAAAAIALVFVLMKATGLLIPPAAALTVLAFLIPQEQLRLYPLMILAGTAAFVLIAKILPTDKTTETEVQT